MEDCEYCRRRGPSSLSTKFSNDTSTMDIDEGYFDDLDLDDEAEWRLLMVCISQVWEGFCFFHIPVFKIRGGRVVDERRALFLRPSMPSVVPNLVATVPPVVETVGNVLSPLPTLSKAPISATSISLIVEVGDDSPLPPDVMVV
ncbi:hypothetical protein Adt_33578 [Abeliophyllum distichum]|uniref:Uncharacterized protein n=1 Tax=Abeliophyllum distichum TaxID=126358 RepID=A0ABD1QWM4_9LAMI